jgi:transcriptional regulator with XRE-family HTH domain
MKLTPRPELNPVSLRVIRELRHVERLDLATAIGIDRSYLSRIEAGTVRPRPEIIRALAECLGVPVEAITQTAERVA